MRKPAPPEPEARRIWAATGQESEMTTGPSAPGDADNERIVDRLRCPSCTADVEVSGAAFRCVSCGADYSESGGIFQFARFGTAETWGEDEEKESSQEYQTQYDAEGRADATTRSTSRSSSSD